MRAGSNRHYAMVDVVVGHVVGPLVNSVVSVVVVVVVVDVDGSYAVVKIHKHTRQLTYFIVS